MREIHNSIDVQSTITAEDVTAVANGSSVSLANFDAAEVVLNIGVFAGTTPTATIKIQESDDGTTFTDVIDTNLLGGALPQIDTTNDNQVLRRGYIGIKPYIRVVVSSIAGAGASLPMAASVIRGFGRKKP